MTLNEVFDYAMAKAYAWADMPFGDETVLIKISTHYFLTLFELRDVPKITVKTLPQDGVIMRELYPDDITRGWHCPLRQQPYNITVDLSGGVPDDVIRSLVDKSYEFTRGKLTRKERENLK